MISESMFISLKVGKTKLVCISERLTGEIEMRPVVNAASGTVNLTRRNEMTSENTITVLKRWHYRYVLTLFNLPVTLFTSLSSPKIPRTAFFGHPS